MLSAGGMETLEKRLLVGIEEDNFNGNPGLLKATVDLLEIGQLTGEVTGIDAHGHLAQPARLGLAGRFPGEGKEQADGQIVDAIESEVFKHMKGGTLARARPATNDNQLHDHLTSTAMNIIRPRRSCAGTACWHPRIAGGDHRTTAH